MRTVIIYLKSDLPPDMGEQPLTPVYMVLQAAGCTDRLCRHKRGKLLPYLFTLTLPESKAVVFCYISISLRTSVISTAQCSALSGLSSLTLTGKSDNTFYQYSAKLVEIFDRSNLIYCKDWRRYAPRNSFQRMLSS